MVDIFLMPEREICKDLGMGVADICKKSTKGFSIKRDSLSFTPKRCSSSTIYKPTSQTGVFPFIRACVPIKISTFLLLKSETDLKLFLESLETSLTIHPKGESLSLKQEKSC